MSVIAGPVVPGPADRHPGLDPAQRRLIVPALAAGLLLDVGLRGGVANAAVALGVGLTVRARWAVGRPAAAEARVFALLAVVPVVFLVVRTSPWLAWPNAVLSAALLLVAVAHSGHWSVLDSTPARLLGRGVSGLRRGLKQLAVVGSVAPRLSPRGRDVLRRVLRGLVVAVPVLLALTALLASADAVFAALLTPDTGVGPALGHVALAALIASLVAVVAGAEPAHDRRRVRRGRLGEVELATILGLVASVLALFVVSQLVAVTGAGDRLVESAGLTPAEYARRGFFQLCWATGLLLAFLAAVRALADPASLRSRVVVALGGTVPVLALGLVVVSLRRMALYDDAFGLTMLRLSVVGAVVWMGVVLVMTAARNLGIGSGREWLLAGAGAAGVMLIVAANLVDPEAFVARHNLERGRGGAEVDVGYLATMSDDVVPVIAAAMASETDPGRRAVLRRALRCGDDAGGVATLNLAARRANALRGELCG